MGVFGAAQAIAFGLGGFLGAVSVDVARLALDSIPAAYGIVFAVEAGLFMVSGLLALRLGRTDGESAQGIDRLTLGRGVIAGVVR